MLIARAPVRISFAGGGTDIPAYYEEYGGVVISTSINKYFYVLVNDLGIGDTQIISADYQAIFSLEFRQGVDSNHPDVMRQLDFMWDGDLALPKAVLAHFKPRQGENVFIACEVPPGTGLGSSSAAAVGLITAFARQRGQDLSKLEIAELACQIEIEKLQMPIGKQDQYASAVGGLNQLEFSSAGVAVKPLELSSAAYTALQERLMLFFTGVSRQSTSILKDQKASIQRYDRAVLENLHALKDLAYSTRRCFEVEAWSDFGSLLDEGWQRKKRLSSSIANSHINELYDIAKKAGTEGGKIVGAGGGGFLLLCCPPDYQANVTKALSTHGLKKLNFQFERQGAHVLLDSRSGNSL